MYQYSTSELSSGKALVRALFSNGATVTATIYDGAGTLVPLTSSACVEIGTTGIFVFDLDNITTKPTAFENFQVVFFDGLSITKYSEFRSGGWIDLIEPTGANLLTLTVEDQNTDPIPDTGVTIYDETQSIIIATGQTDPSGIVLFNLNAASYKVVLQKNQVNFNAVEDLTIVAGANAQTYSGATVTVNVPVDPSTCRVFGFAKTQSGGQTLDAFTGTAEIKELPQVTNNLYHQGDKVTGAYDGLTGEFFWILPQGASVFFKVKEIGMSKQSRIPAAPTAEIENLS